MAEEDSVTLTYVGPGSDTSKREIVVSQAESERLKEKSDHWKTKRASRAKKEEVSEDG